MNEGSPGTPDGSQGAEDSPSPDYSGDVFFHRLGLRAGWRLLIFSALVVILWSGSAFVLRGFLAPPLGVVSPGFLFIVETVSLGAVFIAAWIMARIENRAFGVYGLPASAAFGKLFWQGCLLGLCEASVLVGLIAVFDGYSFGELALHGGLVARWALSWMILFVVVGLLEEFLFRGYAQYTLGEGIGFWPAAILLSFGFGWVHKDNPGENLAGAANVVACGLLFAFALKRTGNLWLAVGMHASFDFAETFLFSVPNSGIVFDGHLSNAALHGPAWLTGGTAGPEGSAFSFLILAIFALVIHIFYPAKSRKAEMPFPAQ